jgi:transposase InsO family protein
LGGRGVHLGYRKGIDGGSWLVRVREPDGRYVTHGLGKADDGKLAADNVNGAGGVLDYEAACRAAAEWERFYNLARPHGAHNGKTPYEALRERL